MARFLAFRARWPEFGSWGDTGGDKRPLKAASRAPGRPRLVAVQLRYSAPTNVRSWVTSGSRFRATGGLLVAISGLSKACADVHSLAYHIRRATSHWVDATPSRRTQRTRRVAMPIRTRLQLPSQPFCQYHTKGKFFIGKGMRGLGGNPGTARSHLAHLRRGLGPDGVGGRSR